MSKKSFYLLAFIMFLSMTGYGVVLPALPYLADELGLSSFQMGSLITGWAFTQFLVVPFWGRLADKWGRKPVLIFGLVGFGLAFLLLLFAKSYLHLLLIRMIGAFLSSGTQPAALAFVSDSFEKKERSQAIAKMAAANALGFLCGPAVGALFSPLGINVPFIVAGTLSLVTIPLVLIYLKEPQQKTSSKELPSFTQSLKVMITPRFRELFFITFGLAVAASSLFSMLGYFLIERFDALASETGIAFSVQSGAAVVIQLFIIGYLYQKYRDTHIAKTGFLFEAAGFLLIVVSFSFTLTLIGCALIGIGQALSRPTLLSLLSRQDQIGQGTVMGLQQSMDSLGRTVGPLVAGALFMLHEAAPFISALLVCLVMLLTFSLYFKDQPAKKVQNHYL
ncbi:MFS transporter [Bacillus sp. PS06]|uniref:MFS transporter n=1 Tax=Bacillus sp. PS06 TaxID=2764176 RepID=UPI00178058A9|nr:MFS transporter [Bacillus sp. PS06]MBD8069069.1 MFS transporter [Bacillus sp. PS06]